MSAEGFSELLRSTALLRDLPEAVFDQLLDALDWIQLPGGTELFSINEAADALYVVLSGSLGAFKPDPSGRMVQIGQIGPGETVGENALILDQPRGATVRALRDSELMRLPRTAFETFVRADPLAMLKLIRFSLKRQDGAFNSARLNLPRTFALVPHATSGKAKQFAREISEAAKSYGSCLLIEQSMAQGKTASWFSEMEAAHRVVFYFADDHASEWTSLCLRQADALVLIADGDDAPSPWPALSAKSDKNNLRRPEHMVLTWHREVRQGQAAAWCKFKPTAKLWHVRWDRDILRLTRHLLGEATALVLSGGGARGFAHLGIVKALREASVPIDAVGGTSIGAIMGAGVAHEWSFEEMRERYFRTFVRSNPLGDYTLPLVSLVAGRRVTKRLQDEFGHADIEDLAIPFFCVSANLSLGVAQVHRAGKLWRWLRASISIPGVLPPVLSDAEVFVDGGVINNLPVDVMAATHRGPIISVDVGTERALKSQFNEFDLPPWWRLIGQTRRRERPGILGVLLRSGMVNSGAAGEAAARASTLLLKPPLASVEMLDWKSFDRAIEIGYRHAVEMLEQQGTSALLRAR